MPLIKYKCLNDSCKQITSVFKKTGKDADSEVICKYCGNKSKKTLNAPASSSKITIDNNQARAVEVHPDIMELRDDHSKPRDRGD